MTDLMVTPNLDLDPWTDLLDAAVRPGHLTRVGMLPDRINNNRAVVALAIELEDGQVVVGYTTWALFATVARALAACPVAQMEGM